MTVTVEQPNNIERYIDANGRLTLEGIKLFQRIVAAINDHEARIVVLEP